MGKISVKRRAQKYVIVNKLQKMEQINQRELHFLTREGPKGILAPVAGGKKKPLVRCEAIAAVPLVLIAKKPVKRKRFFEYVQQILEVICFCDDNKLDARNLMLDMNHIFSTRQTGLLYLVYWPIVNSTANANAYTFFKGLTTSFVFDSQEPLEYVNEYANFFKTHELFSLTQFIRFISQLSGNPIVHMAAESSFFEEKEMPPSITGEMRRATTGGIYADAIYSPAALADAVASGRDLGISKTAKSEPALLPGAETMVLGDVAPSGEDTTVLKCSSSPVLTRQKTGERVMCNTDCLRIGKTPGLCDYVVEGNPAVSKHHADIILGNDGDYYIVDCKSTNGSYIDGIKLVPDEQVSLGNKCQVQLANEIFIFSVE